MNPEEQNIIPISISNVFEEPSISAIWHIPKWKQYHQLICNGIGNAQLEIKLLDGSKVNLVFYMENYTKEMEDHSNVAGQSQNCASLCVTSTAGALPFAFRLSVEFLDANLVSYNTVLKDAIFVLKSQTYFPRCQAEPLSLKCDFIPIETLQHDKRIVTRTIFKKIQLEQPDDLRVKITVVPMSITNASPIQNFEKQTSAEQMLQDIKNIGSTRSLLDIEIETGDGQKLGAHKSILAARSAFFRNSITKEMVKGVIKIPKVSAETMIHILRWIYAGELNGNILECTGNVIEACRMLNLPHMLDMLEIKMARDCNPENMLELLQLAKGHGLRVAAKGITKFVKNNL